MPKTEGSLGPGLALFIASVSALYFELIVIRYVTTEISLFGTLKNLVLVACFAGLGIGMISAQKLSIRKLFGPLALVLFGFCRIASDLPLPSMNWEYQFSFGAYSRLTALLAYLGLSLGILWVIIGFTSVLGSYVGIHINRLPTLKGYGINLAGSLAGILLFTAISFFGAPPFLWLLIGLLILVPLLWKQAWQIAAFAIVILVAATGQKDTYWSPYHRIDVKPVFVEGMSKPPAYSLSYNHLWYQTIVDLSPEFTSAHPNTEPNRSVRDYYELPYKFVVAPKDVLVVGAGTGNDVAAALRHGALYVDAVEIDPVIMATGRRFHPERPYQSDKVTNVVDDARAFFHKTPRRYDLIVFGFLDSSTLLSSYSSIRMDNYVYTRESFEAARKLLKPGGSIIVAFAVTKGWVADRLFATLTQAFDGTEPRAFLTPTDIAGMVFIQGAARNFPAPVGSSEATSGLTKTSKHALIATDHWPFLYLQRRSIPPSVVLVLTLFILTVWLTQRRSVRAAWDRTAWQFFFLGAGFLLLETRAVTEMSLLFGSTWTVNAVVITSFLVMAIAANALVSRTKIRLSVAYLGILATILIGMAVPYTTFMRSPVAVKVIAAGLWAAIPVFFSGLAFSTAIRSSSRTNVLLGVNVLGAVIGGVFENSVMLGGTRLLGILALAFYGLAWLTSRRRQEVETERQISLQSAEYS